MFITIENIQYHWQIKGSGFPIFCLHGFSEDLTTWDGLCLEAYALITIDTIGHGKSDKPVQEKYYGLNIMLNHLHILINTIMDIYYPAPFSSSPSSSSSSSPSSSLPSHFPSSFSFSAYSLPISPYHSVPRSVPRYALLGYSLGGRIALAYALQYPQEINALILESASYGMEKEEDRILREKNDTLLAEKIMENGIEWFQEYWSNLAIFTSQKNLPFALQRQIQIRRLKNTKIALKNTLKGSGQGVFPCFKNKIPQLAMPTLYICGELDKKYYDIGQELSKLYTNICLASVENAGHNVHLEKINTFNALISTFLDGINKNQCSLETRKT